MAGYGRLGATAALAVCLVAGAAHAQALQRPEVLGNWTLRRMTPAEDANVTIKTDTGRLEMPVVVSARGASGLTCVVDGEAADCRLNRGALVITLRMDDARMTYTLDDRGGGGFTGHVRMNLPLLPFGSMRIGDASLIRR
ncbi:MAG: hypothetical protein REJ23_02335 [Brevundimonas sp.]|nr:hypothetical protein [Brevundimonas sp.]